MKETKEKKSTKAGAPWGFGSRCSWGNFENMARMMEWCCGSREGRFDCLAMMKKMCGMAPGESDKA